jgi:D-alanyl-D-alanine-carboxypeptidase/D-alanyl-D-alanine-endopeptidase
VAGLPQQPKGIRLDAWPPLDEALAALRDEDLWVPTFGERKYSNTGFGILGNALGRAAGQPYTAYVRKAIFAPLGMNHSGWVPTDEMKKRLAVGYDPVSEDGTRGRSSVYVPGEGGSPAGGLRTSARDMARFMAAYLYEGPADETHILAGSTVRELRQPAWVARGWKFGQGIGWMFWPDGEGRTVMAHGGGTLGFTAKVMMVPEVELAFFVAINERTAIDDIADPPFWGLASAFAAARERWEAAQPPPPLPANVEDWIGIYELDPPTEGQQVEVAVEDGWLRVFGLEKGVRAYPARLVPVGDATFRLKGGPFDTEKAAFERDEASGEVRMQLGAFTVVKPAPDEDD